MSTHTADGGPDAGAAIAGSTQPDPEAVVLRVQELVDGLGEIGDPAARQLAEELVGSVIDLYGQGLERILRTLEQAGEPAAELLEELAADGLVASLMLIHGLYPVDLETRVQEALDGVRPYMESHAGNVELLGITDGVARIRLEGSCRGCAASSATLELAIKQALDEAAPDLEGLEVEGAVEAPHSSPAPSGMELPVLQVDADGGTGSSAPVTPTWFDLEAARAPTEGTLRRIEVGSEPLLLANVGGTLLAYLDRCAGCGASLVIGELDGSVLACATCQARFDLRAAGRELDGSDGQLDPIPLLREGDGMRVALAV
ncbi:MAG TPA: NifU family protein [Solirubrobacterales bacterium]|nr:NifU family protein [Solirubrobacterales bacterium]